MTGGPAGNGGAAGSSVAGGTAGGAGSGAAGAAGAGAGGAADAGALPHVVGKCDKLGPVGTWEQITPPQVSLDRTFQTPAGTNYGIGVFVIDPQNTATVY